MAKGSFDHYKPLTASGGKQKKLRKIVDRRAAANDSGIAQLKIYQVYYEEGQRNDLDSAFTPFDNAKDNSGLFEFSVFKKLAKKQEVERLARWGAVSWKFGEKTGVQGRQLIELIESKPEIDLFYCNPEPFYEGLFHNFWLQGETRHPGLLSIVSELFRHCGLNPSELNRVHQSVEFSSANYFIGSQRFWDLYLPFIENVLRVADEKLSPDLRDLMWSSKGDPRQLHKGSSYVPFIVERLFPVFLRTVGRQLSASKFALPAREREMNDHIRRLRELKDAAIKAKSDWLLQAWLNYRNLYLQSVSSKQWCQQYLPLLNPKEVIW